MTIAAALTRIQNLAIGMTGISIKSAPDYPIENVDPLPMAIAYVSGGQFHATNKTTLHNFPEITVEFHFSRTNLKQAYQQIGLVAYEFPQRLAGDPTLAGAVVTLNMGIDNPVTYTVRPFDWGNVQTMMLQFVFPLKILEAPLTTA